MLKKFYLVNTPELPIPGTHYYTSHKFMSGFKHHGYQTIEANKLSDIKDGSIVLLSNHGVKHAGSSNDAGWNAVLHLANAYPNCIYICWFYHNYYNNIPFKRFILTGEHFHYPPKTSEHYGYWELQQKINNYLPLTFAANLEKYTVGKYHRTNTVNGCFMGTAYKPDWVYELPNIIYLTGMSHGKPISEEERVQCFLSSKIAFGFHSDNNILNNVVVERVFEGMAYGCVVISDNPAAGLITNGIVQVATTKDEFLKIYFSLLNDNDKLTKLQQQGYEWIRQKGLYEHIAQNFIEKFNTI